MPQLARRMSRAKPSAIMAVAEKAKRLKAAGRDIISFSIGVPNFLPGPHIYAAATEALAKDSGQYGSNRGADALLDALLPHSGHAFRLGISGVPGVGKSTFIEALGLWLIGRGHRVAVLAVDPSSSVSGGSILGDKTRMERLAVQQRAFIRPSPASGPPGGVAEKTPASMLVAEPAA